MIAYINPYYGTSFFEFFLVLGKRLIGFLSGQELSLASDEIQLLTLISIAITTSLIGTFLVLRQMTMLANSLSHTILIGIVAAYFFNNFLESNPKEFDFSSLVPHDAGLLVAGGLSALLTVWLTYFFTSKMGIARDAAIGIVFTFLFAVGILFVTMLSRDSHIGTELLMGNADALSREDLVLQVHMMLINMVIIAIFFRGFFLSSFDPVFSYALGFSSAFFGYLLMLQVGICSITAFRAVGVMLVLSFFVGPPLIARRLTCHLTRLLLLAAGSSIVITTVGVALSRHLLSIYFLPVSTSALISVLIAISYLVVLLRPSRA
jgi:manganese/zinc/iron transport system permease protein